MADYKIQNDVLEVCVNKKGAELVSLVRRKDGKQYMWSGDAAYWNRVSPVLFPFVGKLNGQRYQFEGTWYEGIGQHDFARDMEFSLISQEDGEIWLQLESSEKTLQMYPFDFVFDIGYRVVKNEVQVLWKVHNRSEKAMYFSLGAHPAFLCPEEGAAESCKDGYLLDLHTKEDSVQSGELTEDGVLGTVTKTLPLKNGCLELTDSLFDQDALILNAGAIQQVSLKNPEQKEYLSVSFDTPLLGIWSPAKKAAPFVCIEPWYGRCDREGFAGDLSEREYGNKLEAGQIFERSYTIKIAE